MTEMTRRGLLGSAAITGSYLVYGNSGGSDLGGGAGGTSENLAAVTDGVDQIGWESATLLGRLEIMEGTSYAEAFFEFRPTGAEDVTMTATERLEEPQDFSRAVSDLMPDTEYEVRAVVESANAYDEASWTTFQTEAKPNIEVVTTNGVEEIGQTEARVHGEVIEMTNIEEANAYFEYRATTATEYQDSDGILIQSPQQYDELLTGLEPATEYEARARADATQGDWTDNGKLITWTTKAAIPDSAINQYLYPDYSSSQWADSIGALDLTTIDGLTDESAAFGGTGGVSGDGTDAYAQGGQFTYLQENYYDSWAFAFGLTLTSSGGYLAGINNAYADLWQVGIGDDYTSGHIGVSRRFNSNSVTLVQSDVAVNDGGEYVVIIQSTGPTASDLEIYFEPAVNSATINNSGTDGSGSESFNSPNMTYYARNSDGTLESYLGATLTGIRWFNSSLSESERSDVFGLYDWYDPSTDSP